MVAVLLASIAVLAAEQTVPKALVHFLPNEQLIPGDAPAIDLHHEGEHINSRAPTTTDSRVSCGVDKYYWGAYLEKHFCVECPKGFISEGCEQCAPDPNHRACVLQDSTCQAGKFFSIRQATCVSCPAGKWNNEDGQRSCNNCPEGKFNPPGINLPLSCTDCPTGKFSALISEGNAECNSCTFCKAGQYGSTMGPGSDSEGSCICQECAVGQYAEAGQPMCHNCMPGRYAQKTGSSTCVYCAMGAYQPSPGAEECLACPDDYYSNRLGATECELSPAKTVIFRVYGYKHKAALASKGWKLMTAEQFPLFESLLLKEYKRRQGLQVLVGFSSPSCCLSVGDGLRLTAETTFETEQQRGVKRIGFVYPFDSTGILLRCDVANFNQYDAGERLKLQYHSGLTYKDISTAEKLGLLDVTSAEYESNHKEHSGMHGGLCSHQADENNPGIYIGTLTSVADRSECEEIAGTEYCLEPPPKTHAPTAFPTPAPTSTPTKAPTPVPAPQDCKVSTWTFWSGCSATCGLGNQTRTREITSMNHNGGAACPVLFDSRPCEMEGCENDCTLTTWTSWTKCSKTCGGGEQTRQRSMIEAAKFGGRCYATDGIKNCNSFECPIDCQWGDYGAWGLCSASCGLGKQMRRRDLKVVNSFNGKPCDGAPTEYQDCQLGMCPIDCEIGHWQAWSACAASCGFGTHYRLRKPVKLAKFGGRNCPAQSQKRFCHSGDCPVDCVVGVWGDWSACSKSCGEGVQTKSRAVTKATEKGGRLCPALSLETSCEIVKCPENCEVTAWSLWEQCSHTCGQGSQARTRTITKQPGFGGDPCPAVDEDRLCNLEPCPVHCTHEEWSEWTACSKTCGVGTQSHTRTIKTEAKHSGSCDAPLTEEQACKLEDCALDCTVSDWEVVTPCTKSCGTGMTKKVRQVIRPAKAGGTPCPSLTDEGPCNAHLCPVDCQMTEWTAWGACSVSCGPGSKTRTRTVKVESQGGGTKCPEQRKEVSHCMHIGSGFCPTDCEVNQWTAWSRCSATCEAGKKHRQRQVTHPPTNGGAICPPLAHSTTCLVMKNCPVSCVLASWSAWPTECPGTCGFRLQFRHRKVLRAHRYGGRKCDLMVQSKMCVHEHAPHCPSDCELETWGAWTECSKSCGAGGNQHRKRLMFREKGGGKPCHDTEVFQQRMCNEQIECPIDCVLESWTSWSSCTKSCNSGSTARSRKVNKPALKGGICSTVLHQEKACNLHHCPIDCITNAWGDWGDCSVSCGPGGMRKRTRKIFSPAQHGGKCVSEHTEACAVVECPIDCTLTTWGLWGECSKSCGVGVQARKRTLLTYEGPAPVYPSYNRWSDTSNGGSRCPPLEQIQECKGLYYHTAHLEHCGSTCMVGPWEDWSACTKTCGLGTQLRIRSVQSNPHNAQCPQLQDMRRCNMQDCSDPNKPIGCEMSSWGSWGQCSLMVDGSCSRQRQRKVELVPSKNGKMCPKASNFETCGDSHNKLQCVDGLPHNAKYLCSHVTCQYVRNKAGKGRVVVLHHNHEIGGQGHLCAYSQQAHSCTCLCSHDLRVTDRPICQNYMKGLTHMPCNNHPGLATSQQLVRN